VDCVTDYDVEAQYKEWTLSLCDISPRHCTLLPGRCLFDMHVVQPINRWQYTAWTSKVSTGKYERTSILWAFKFFFAKVTTFITGCFADHTWIPNRPKLLWKFYSRYVNYICGREWLTQALIRGSVRAVSWYLRAIWGESHEIVRTPIDVQVLARLRWLLSMVAVVGLRLMCVWKVLFASEGIVDWSDEVVEQLQDA
jgi:hypothetical protein